MEVLIKIEKMGNNKCPEVIKIPKSLKELGEMWIALSDDYELIQIEDTTPYLSSVDDTTITPYSQMLITFRKLKTGDACHQTFKA